ncbi:MAG: murein L,D-transpeptidase catalytic domain family protein [Chitinophagaceae bacterium]|nr:murein L,D-transpeptidase catalytic domain family protein [Chitinophagaceae bacterium]
MNAEATTALYNDLHLESAGLNQQVFELAIKGFSKIVDAGKIHDTRKITIIDFSQPSSKKRLYVLDLDARKIVFQSVVSHGRNTGTLWAKSFSNQAESFKSSPGFYITAETYNGGNGYSLRLDGLERNINDNARNRAIVMHGAPYANESSIGSLGFLGRSQGCPALPQSINKAVINTIKNGTCLFIYTPDQSYLNRSDLLS